MYLAPNVLNRQKWRPDSGSALAIHGEAVLFAVVGELYDMEPVWATGGVQPYTFEFTGDWPAFADLDVVDPVTVAAEGTPTNADL